MQGFISSNPIYISALKNDRNFTQVKSISLTDTTTEISLGKSNIYKMMLKNKSILSLDSTLNCSGFTISKKSNDKTTNVGSIYIENGGIGLLYQDISLSDNESLIVTCDSTIDAEYELIIFRR